MSVKLYHVHKRLLGYVVIFYCEVCGKSISIEPSKATSKEEALTIAWEMVRLEMNCCGYCGKWHCDHCHDLDSMLCIKCAPHAKKETNFHLPAKICLACKSGNQAVNNFCTTCGKQL